MSDTTVFSSTVSITESENSFGVPEVASPQKSQHAKGPQSPVAAVDSENAALEVSFVDDDDEEEVNQFKPEKGSKKEKRTNAATEEDECVYIKVLADNETIHRFQIKSSTKMARLMGAYSLETGLPIGNFRFYYQGRTVDKNDTIQSLALQWGSIIEALTDPEGWDDSFNEFINSL
ncbi:hypothetical protein KR026_009979 [Drosophila bipectinata]|nr:hypothetical protein KR026_009979 [Drosophila bipectinata]